MIFFPLDINDYINKSQLTLLNQEVFASVSYGGYHRNSIFHLLVGDAISQRNPELMPKSWKQEETTSTETKEFEYLHETRVSEYLVDMTLLFVSIPNASAPDIISESIESNAITLTSGYCEPSPDKPTQAISSFTANGSN